MFKGAKCEKKIKTEIIHLVKGFMCGLLLNLTIDLLNIGINQQ